MRQMQERSGKGILLFCVVFCVISLASFESRGGPQKGAQTGKEGTASKNRDLMAVLSCRGYGYKVNVLVNGVDVGIAGGKSENRRLLNKGNGMAVMAAPEMKKQNFMLVPGDNTISVTFKKKSANKDDRLELSLEMQNYPGPLFKMVTKKSSGKVKKKIVIQNTPPAGFKTVTVAD